ncbi:MATE family efflux transporter, partial [Gemmiger sp.]
MEENKSLEIFENAPVRKAVLQNALPAMAAMLMVLVYNLADTFFIGQTHDDLQVAAVSLATPVFLLFMAVGTIFGIGGTSVISRAMGEGRKDYAKKVCAFSVCQRTPPKAFAIAKAFGIIEKTSLGRLPPMEKHAEDARRKAMVID